MDYIKELWNSSDGHIIVEIGLTIFLVILFFIVKKIVAKIIMRHAVKVMHSKTNAAYIIKLSSFGLSLIFITLIVIVWEISIQGLSIYFASFFTIVGVAFFAVWSILSNVTAYAILFFSFPFKIGSRIRIVDGDNSVEGKIDDITFFYMRIRQPSGDLVTYPNNLALQKPIKLLPK